MRSRTVSRAALIGAALLAAPAMGQQLLPRPVSAERTSGPAVQALVLEGDRVADGVLQAILRAQIDRQGEIGFTAFLSQGGRERLGLFVWADSRVAPLAVEGQETGRGPLLMIRAFGDWAWNSGRRAVFLGAIDRNRNGKFDPGVDPVVLFLATPGRLTPLIAVGDRLDGGLVLAIPSFRLNESGEVAIQALIDRNANGSFDVGTDAAGIYLIQNTHVTALLHDGDRLGDERIVGLDAENGALRWQLNNRADFEVRLRVQRAAAPSLEQDALIVIDRTGRRFLLTGGLRTSAGTFDRVGGIGLNNRGDVVFPAALSPGFDAQFGLFRLSLGPSSGRVEALTPPLLAGPDGTLIGDLISDVAPDAMVTDTGDVGFFGLYRHLAPDVDGNIPEPLASFVLTPTFLYEVVREGTMIPWGLVGGIEQFELNNRTQAAVQVAVQSPDVLGTFVGGSAILYWENGVRVGLVGPGDRIAVNRVVLDDRLIGLSDTGLLAFDATILNDDGRIRHGLFAVAVPSGHT